MKRAATRRFRFRLFEVDREPGGIAADESAMPEYEAVCVSGDETDCGAESGPLTEAEDLNRWMAEHTRDTKHTRYRRAYCEYALVEPGEWL